jgi:DNA invertase Pin-like site-specific DNA recombinase
MADHRAPAEKTLIVLEGRQSGNVSAVCEKHGIGRSTYYRWFRRAQLWRRRPDRHADRTYGLSRRRGRREMTPQQKEQIRDLAKTHPEWSRARVAQEVGVSESGVYAVWERHNIATSIEMRTWQARQRRQVDRL